MFQGGLFHPPVEQPLPSTTEPPNSASTVPPASSVPPPTSSAIQLLSGAPSVAPVALPPPAMPTVSVAPPLTKPTHTSSVAPYTKKTVTTIPRRPFSSPTLLVKHGHKVQRLMMPTKAITPNGHMTYIRSADGLSGMLPEAIPNYSLITPPPTPDTI